MREGLRKALRHPLGVSIGGGLLVSQVLTLFTTPVIYLWFDRLSVNFRARFGNQPVAPPAAGGATSEPA